MRFLILQAKNSPGRVFNDLVDLVNQHGHTPVGWTHGITEKDYDAILAIAPPCYDYTFLIEHHYDSSDPEFLDFDVDLGRGVFEGVTGTKKPAYLVIYDYDKVKEECMLFVNNLRYTKYPDETNYSIWGFVHDFTSANTHDPAEFFRDPDFVPIDDPSSNAPNISHSGDEDMLLLS